MYKTLGMKKFYFSPVSSKDFENIDPNVLKPDLSIPVISETSLFPKLDEASQKSVLDFNKEGYAILNQYIDSTTVDNINAEIESLLETNTVKYTYGNKIMFAIRKSASLRKVGDNPELVELLSSIMKAKVRLFQSINFKTGSEQDTHSDSIHMTTFPLGGIFGVWIALEDIDEDNGPLHYYPESHKLPYYLNKEYNNEGNFFLTGKEKYTQYEKMIQDKIAQQPLTKKIFTAKKGDVLIWHANLFHGGEPHVNKEKGRRSMVFHYFATDRICYHEITQRPALID